MSAENEIFERLGKLEREVYLISDALKDLKAERIVPRIVVLEEFTKQVKDDVASIEKLSQEIADVVRTQKSVMRGFCIAAAAIFSFAQAWPIIKEILKGALQ